MFQCSISISKTKICQNLIEFEASLFRSIFEIDPCALKLSVIDSPTMILNKTPRITLQ